MFLFFFDPVVMWVCIEECEYIADVFGDVWRVLRMFGDFTSVPCFCDHSSSPPQFSFFPFIYLRGIALSHITRRLSLLPHFGSPLSLSLLFLFSLLCKSFFLVYY